jgi:activator of 2-hydroxyglutaryl-CoA dehydratase
MLRTYYKSKFFIFHIKRSLSFTPINNIKYYNIKSMTNDKTKATIANGEIYLGIEFGSTRIKATIINNDNTVIATGSHQ